MRIALAVEYDGSRYMGWQRQSHGDTVQGRVEAALSRVADHPVEVYCAGRTDAGVHALGQIIHFDSDADRSLRAWVLGTNCNLPDDIAIRWAQPVADDFHARFSARSRRYRYVIDNRWVRPALHQRRVTWHYHRLDEARMHEAGQALLGEHDFSSYRALGCQAKHPVRELYELRVTRSGDFLYLDVHANGFLHHMVRNIAGVLMAIGQGERPVEWAEELLAVRDRTLGGVTAPAHGLYFVTAYYDADVDLPPPPAPPVFG